ncbi:MAG: 30S ribosomal protein S13 [Thermoplasmatales archaeon]|jgi:small subunit ribosomal protein S13|nr:30S ribosomal protein S13 [Candidatus Thermoplasmatota archaeon]MCL6002440.1 30S ribosomal protein S13 [Candidatus Thermoplasmatota archaeon]MDA8054790.1 30S ribosomal protein S13 [Thermoplasmatales archaeon]
MAEQKEKNENIKYIVRIANTNLDGTRQAVYALSNIRGIGYRTAEILLKKMSIPRDVKLGEIDDSKIDEIKDAIDKRYSEFFPTWTLNHRNDIQTGENLLKVGPDLGVALQDDVNRMKRTRSYKGIRHEKGKKVRGQRTRSNGRKGLAVGVIKKREGAAPAEAAAAPVAAPVAAPAAPPAEPKK